MDKVREQVAVKRTWLNTNMTACHALPKTNDPPITCAQIKAELKVCTYKYVLNSYLESVCLRNGTRIYVA